MITTMIQGKNVDAEIRVHVIVLTVYKQSTSDKCWDKFSKLERTQVVDSTSTST